MVEQKSIFKGAETRKLVENKDYTFAISRIGKFAEMREIDILPTKSFELNSVFQKTIILPLVGACQVKTGNQAIHSINYEQILAVNESTESINISILNNVDSKIKVLVISLNGLLVPSWQEKVKQSDIYFSTKNEWATISQFDFIKLGVFESRYECDFSFENQIKTLLLTLRGSFEINGRLINTGDSLFLEESVVELEALSENSIILSINL